MGCVAEYDLAHAPASWDFLQFLINAKLQFGKFNVAFRKGPVDGFRADRMQRSVPQRRAIFENVMIPALKLVGAEEVDGPGEQVSYFQIEAVKAANRGRPVPKWKIPAEVMDECRAWLGERKPLVITLREADYYPERNSNLEAWLAFARTVDDVIFVRDTAKADELLPFETCPRASRDLLFRAALMSLARCNFLVGNGPALLVEYLDAPWLMFNPVRPELDYRPVHADWWIGNVGVIPGDQFPWARADQRIVWEHDSLTNIQAAWKAVDVPLLPPIKTFAAMSEADRFEQIKINCIRNRNRLKDEQPAHDRTAVLVCYGPSLKDTWHVAAQSDGDIFTVSGSHGFLLSRGVVPFAQIDCDPRPHKAAQFGTPHHSVKYWLGSCVHPDYLDRLVNHSVKLWHLHNGPESAENIWSIEPEAWLCVGGGSVGLRSISLLYSQGYRHFEIHGMDCSLAEGETYAGEHLGKKQKTTRVRSGDRWFDSTLQLIDYARQFLDDLRLWPGATFRVHGDGLLAHMVQQGAKQ